LADDLLEAGYRAITVLDLSEMALSSVKAHVCIFLSLASWWAIQAHRDHFL
jgi:hypothetical protein